MNNNYNNDIHELNLIFNSCLTIANRFLHNYDYNKLPQKFQNWKEKLNKLSEAPIDKIRSIEKWMNLIVEEYEQSNYFLNYNKKFDFDNVNEEKIQQLLILKNDNKILNNEIKNLRKELEYKNAELYK